MQKRMQAGLNVVRWRVAGDPSALDFETLDFQEMASSTRDFSAVEQIHKQQVAALNQQGGGLLVVPR